MASFLSLVDNPVFAFIVAPIFFKFSSCKATKVSAIDIISFADAYSLLEIFFTIVS